MPEPRALAAAMLGAADDRSAVERLTASHPSLDVDTAYAAQWCVIQELVARGQRVVGLKLGLTSAAKQRTMGVDQPLYGWLTNGMLLDASAPLPMERWIHPRVEPEIAFVMGSSLAGPVSIAEVLSATTGICAAIEVIDSRYADFSFALPDVIVDNASAAGYVVGPRLVAPGAIEDLRLLGCVLRRNGEIAHTAAGAAVMGHPAAAVAWLSAQLGMAGRSIPAGSLVLAGALTDAVAVEPGSVVSAEFADLGTIEVRA